MLILARRYLVLIAFAFWLGGFTFYAGVVVPLGTDILGSAAEQARVTRVVSWYLNAISACALAIFLLDWLVTQGWTRLGLWLVMLACLGVLVWLHPQLDAMFHYDEAYIDDRKLFRPWHRTYLWVSTVQWAAGAIWGLFTLHAWRREG